MRPIVYFVLPAVILFAGILPAGCGKGAQASDTARTMRQETGTGPSALDNYDGDRARQLCNKFSSGMLDKNEYAEIIGMVRTAYFDLSVQKEALLSAKSSLDDFTDADMRLSDMWREKYPHAEFLNRILVESENVDMGDENRRQWEQLNSELKEKSTSFRNRYRAKFPDSPY